MKKRSLVAAIAMLVVSAIVLTSATYAWFSTSNQSRVELISATVTNSNSNLKVKATGAWAKNTSPTTKLTENDYYLAKNYDDEHPLPDGKIGVNQILNPITISCASNSAPVFKTLNYDGTSYSSVSNVVVANDSITDFMKYSFDVVYQNASDGKDVVTIAPTFTAVPSANGFTRGIIEIGFDGGSAKTYYITEKGYQPITAINPVADPENAGEQITSIKDSPAGKADIIDSADTGAQAAYGELDGFILIPAGGITFDVNAGASKTANVTVYVWAEGQDENCTGMVEISSGFEFALSVAPYVEPASN